MKSNLIFSFIVALCLLCSSCGPSASDLITGTFIPGEDNKGNGYVRISHINKNIYGISLSSNRENGDEAYIEADYNATERILSAKSGYGQSSFKYSEDYSKLYIVGHSKDEFFVRE